jgi:hypothetical protein
MLPTKLTNGRIPAFTACPFKATCSTLREGKCHHRDTEHPVAFSCATARGFDLMERYDMEKIRED